MFITCKRQQGSGQAREIIYGQGSRMKVVGSQRRQFATPSNKREFVLIHIFDLGGHNILNCLA